MSKQQTIRLDNQWSVVGKKYNWELRQQVKKTREKKDGTIEEYTANDSYYHHNLQWVLKKYMQEALKPVPTIGSIILKLDEIEDSISKIKVK